MSHLQASPSQEFIPSSYPSVYPARRERLGIVNLSEFEQKLGNTRIHNSLIVQHLDYWTEVEN